jgi:hypothetical protein
MDPIIIGIGAKVVEKLMPYVTEGAEKLTQAVGEAAVGKLESLLQTLKSRFGGDKEVTGQIERFEKKPEIYKATLADILQEKLEQDKNFAQEIDKLLKDIPNLNVEIKLNEAEKDVTGVEVENFRKGNVNVDIDIKTAKGSVTGGKIKNLG